MSTFDSEIKQLKSKLESEATGKYEILTCTSEIIQIKFSISSFRILSCVVHVHPTYPQTELFVELKAKHFSPVLVKKLTSLTRIPNKNHS